MKLFLNKTSPFARLVQIVIQEKQLAQPELVWSDPWLWQPELITVNPFSIIPVLLTDQGESIYESYLIISFLHQQAGKPLQIASWSRLSYGKQLMETTFRHVTLLKNSPPDTLPHPFIARTEQMLINGLSTLPAMLPENITMTNIDCLQLMIALDYLQFRLPELATQWYTHEIKQQLAAYQQRESFRQTAP